MDSRPYEKCEQYHRLGESGVPEPDARVELIEGEIVDMPPMGARHYGACSRLNEILTRAVGDRALVNMQLPIRLGQSSECEPDIAVLKWREDHYASALPTPEDALLLIEVADTTLEFDLVTKARI